MMSHRSKMLMASLLMASGCSTYPQASYNPNLHAALPSMDVPQHHAPPAPLPAPVPAALPSGELGAPDVVPDAALGIEQEAPAHHARPAIEAKTPPVQPQEPSQVLSGKDIPFLEQQSEADDQAFFNTYTDKRVFADQGRFQQFTKAAEPQDLWIAVVNLPDPAGAQVACFYDHDQLNLDTLRPGQRVRVSGRVGLPLNHQKLTLTRNCAIEPL